MEKDDGGRKAPASPDIADITEPSAPKPMGRKSARAKKNAAESSNKDFNESNESLQQLPSISELKDEIVNQEEDIEGNLEPEPVRRPRGRPKKGTKKMIAVIIQQKKGRKPKVSDSVRDDEHEPCPIDIKSELIENSVDEIEANVKEISISTQEGDFETPSSSMMMEVDQSTIICDEVASIFDLKEEKSYNRDFIPGLDLLNDNEDAVDSSTNLRYESLKCLIKTVEKQFQITDQQAQDDAEETKIRRSSRIKTLEEQRGTRGRRREVVFSSSMESSSSLSRSLPNLNDDDSNSNSPQNTGEGDSPQDFSVSSGMVSGGSSFNGSTTTLGFSNSASKPLKVKSRWRYSSDAESMKTSSDGYSDIDSQSFISSAHSSAFGSTSSMYESDTDSVANKPFVRPTNLMKRSGHLLFNQEDTELFDKLKKFQGIEESIFKTERKISKESRGMVCDCFLTNEDVERGEVGCNEDCLNRLLMVECGSRCPTGEMCTNKKFQRKEYAPLEVFKTDKKGHGLRTLDHITEGGFVIEYVGEVLDPWQFEKRTNDYAKGNQEHFYFMALKSDAIIDATLKGNCSRFINHSCEPNCETQKWTVNGELRIGFFTLRDLKPGEEIVFDYQFQRYGKKAQRCFCMSQSCRGWIGEEDEDDEERETGEDVSEVEPEKVKKKTRAVRKKRADKRILEDVALEEELSQLERTGLKNRNHTLTLSRLMVRAEKWDDRERILNILINGDSPCRRLFLDYRGLKLLYNWMVNLPLPSNETKEQLIKDEEYHQMFLKALLSLPIPNKTMLLDSKILSLIDTWSIAPSKTEIIIQCPIINEKNIQEVLGKTEDENELKPNEDIDISVKSEDLPMPIEVDVEQKVEVSSLAPETENIVQQFTTTISEINWKFVDVSKSLIDSWADLKEVFRIPKKERVEQMKEHEREADKGSALNNDNFTSSSYSYDRDGRSKWISSRTSNRGDRRTSVIDSYSIHRQSNMNSRMMMYTHLSKEERRSMFAQRVAQEEEDTKQRKMQEEIVSLHQHRCGLLSLDPCTTPVVDISGHYYLDPNTIEWKLIDVTDPSLPAELLLLVNAAQEPVPQAQIQELNSTESEFVFPPWPEGLPPPPPLPPSDLPEGWKLAVADEGLCYYYHIKSRQTQWHPPSLEDYIPVESTESSDSMEDLEENDVPNENAPVVVKPMLTLRTRLIERAHRRKKSGLVQERIISPRTDEDKSHISKAVIRARKLEVLEEKKQKVAEELKTKNLGLDEVMDSSPHPTPPEDKSKIVEVKTMEVDEESMVINEFPNQNPPTKKRRSESPKPEFSNEESDKSDSQNCEIEEDHEDSDSPFNTSPIETELDISLAAAGDDDTFSESQSLLEPETLLTTIPGLGFDPRDRPSTSSSSIVILKKDRSSKKEKKQKSIAYKKITTDKCKEAFRNQIATVIVTHLNPYRKPDCKSGRIVSTEDFKHLARKMTHAILLKELKHSKEGKTLEVTDSVKHKTKEYIKKFMARFGTSNYVPSPEDTQEK